MAIERSRRPMAAARIARATQLVLDASTLCAMATVSAGTRAHVNTAYFAWSPRFDLVWLSEPHARHSRNIDTNGKVAIAVYNSRQSWGKPDRGIQLFGSAREVKGATARHAEMLYRRRFPEYEQGGLTAYRFYRFRPRRLKLFDERELGMGVFVTAKITGAGRLEWERTEIYRAGG
jgi:uncharacterized protein YhbP (UPF0306 family)